MSATLRPNASAIAFRFSETLRLRSITPFATGPTTIFFMYMRGTGIMLSGLPAAMIESAPTPPRATTAGPSTGSSARSSRRPPPPSSTPSASGWPSSVRPITIRQDSGISWSASAMATLAASSAARPSPRPR